MTTQATGPVAVACVKWVDLHPEADPLTGDVTTDVRRFGFSEADRAAVEVALRHAESTGGSMVLVSCAPAAAEPALRDLAACGAHRVIRVDMPDHSGSRDVAASLVAAVHSIVGGSNATASGAAAVDVSQSIVVCGDYSLDLGSGTVPGFVAAALGWAQALGAIEVAEPDHGSVLATRRLDGGRRERLHIDLPAVVSVEGAVRTLRRAPMRAVVAARSLTIEVLPEVDSFVVGPLELGNEPCVPRARVVAAPSSASALDRVVELTGALVERTPPRRVTATPAEAAVTIVEQLKAWGYLDA